MTQPTRTLDILSGKQRGAMAAAVRTLLWCVTPGYRLALFFRRLVWKLGWKKPQQAGVPVLSVGNLTAGGTGKTPLVIWIAGLLRNEGRRVAVLSRGYRQLPGGSNDETLELQNRLPDVPVVENADRAAGARLAVGELEMEVLLLDDGFQHWQLARDLDIVVVDATEPFGYGHLLPRGLLREPLSALRRAHRIVISRANLVDDEAVAHLELVLSRFLPTDRISISETTVSRWIRSDGSSRPLEDLASERLLAFCGIGNPDSFFRLLGKHHAAVAASRSWPDHHHFTDRDLADMEQMAHDADASVIVCTAKDLVKIPRNRIGRFPLYALETGLGFRRGEAELRSAVLRAAGRSGHPDPA